MQSWRLGFLGIETIPPWSDTYESAVRNRLGEHVGSLTFFN